MNNLSYPISALYLVPSTTYGSFLAHFATNNEGVKFGQEYSHIKAFIADINKRKESGWMTQGKYDQTLRHQWIPMVGNFINSWRKVWLLTMCMLL